MRTKLSLTFIYDDNGQALGFYYDTNLNDSNPGTKYYYVCNAQGDVLQLRSHTNAPVANYYYDTWGKLLGITDANGNAITASNHVAVLNPIRYRGYFYDTETGFYYLNSRYYDPQIGRFINADGYVSTGQGFLGFNMFAYCNNNPVMFCDDAGTFAAAMPFGGLLAGVGGLVQGLLDVTTTLVEEIYFLIDDMLHPTPVPGASSPSGSSKPMNPSEACEPLPPLVIPKTEEKEKEATAPNPKKQAYFPSNPYDFHPKGLISKVYPGSYNGKTIK